MIFLSGPVAAMRFRNDRVDGLSSRCWRQDLKTLYMFSLAARVDIQSALKGTELM